MFLAQDECPVQPELISIRMTEFQPHDVFQFPVDLPAHTSKTGIITYPIPAEAATGDDVPYELIFNSVNQETEPVQGNLKDAGWIPEDWFEIWNT